MVDYRSERLTRFKAFSIQICEFSKKCNHNYVDQLLIRQLIRSGTAPSLMYAEALSAESLDDLTHKLSMVLKELRETGINLEILLAIVEHPDCINTLKILLEELNELLKITSKAVSTCKQKKRQNKPKK